MKKLLLLAYVAIHSIVAVSQTHHNHQHEYKEINSFKNLDLLNTNSFGIADKLWNDYFNQTSLLLEKIDEDSFLNYVLIKESGNITDKSYFIGYINDELVKDFQLLIYKVGNKEIDATSISTYFTALQPKWLKLYQNFLLVKSDYINKTNALRGPGGNGNNIFGCGSAFTNPGFESGTGSWNYWIAEACPLPDPCFLAPGFNAAQHALTNVGMNDPVVGAAIPQVAPGGGTHSMLLGNYNVTGGDASRVSISFDVTPANTIFTYRYAVVLQDPVSGHSDDERPYFRVRVRDIAGNIIPCGDYEVIAKPPMTGFIAFGSSVYYRPWTTVSVPLSAYIGKCVSIEFTSSDCSQGGHYGYAYVDADCGSLEVSSVKGICGQPDTLIAPQGMATYAWSNTSAGGTTGIISPPNNDSVAINQTGTYQVVMSTVSGATCTTSIDLFYIFKPTRRPVAEFSFTPNPASAFNPKVYFIDESSSDVTSWSWDFGDPVSGPDNTSILQNPSHVYPDEFEKGYDAELIVENDDGCKDTVMHRVFIGPEFTFFIPNVFSPNGDGLNDQFFGQGVGIADYDMWIYDRWGDMIFHGEKLTEKWDGKANKGDKVAQQDVYVWKVILKDVFGEEHTYIGTVTLVR